MAKTKTKTVKVTNVTKKLAEQEKQECAKENKKLRFSKLIVLLVIAMILGFTGATLYVFAKVGSEPGVLIGAFFAFATGEL
ncbi:MAG: hypothetical protein MJ246_08760 [Clostridia bacterium]|nr:hypothetical protein [Clostridia bacterium]